MKILIVVPYPSVAELIKTIIQEQNDKEWEYEILVNIGVRSIVSQDIKSDVVIARGVTASALKRSLPNTPVVELLFNGYDILRSVSECLACFHDRKIGIVGSYDMICGAKSIEDILDIELVTVEVNHEDDAELSIKKLQEGGIHTVIGGVMSSDIAKRLGMNSLFIESGREAVYFALQEAKRVAAVRRQEQERTEQFRAILHYSDEGIIAVDTQGKINVMNMAAMNITNLHDEVIGRNVSEVLPQLDLGKVLVTGKSEIGEIQTVENQQIAINTVPILIAGERVGVVATFKPIGAIQELEGKIREKIHNRGHIAKLKFENILGSSKAIKDTIAVAREFSKVNSNVLIVGETGTGKEVFAQSVHNGSSRCKGPFVAVNCAALPENLLESELFGYVEGAFTGASRGGKFGLFELAHRGSIFLDEVSEISPKMQGRLLRVLQEREIMRLGDDRVIPIDVRIIAATNKDLYELVKERLFREDLYYRLDILQLRVPSLRERGEDIILLMNHFYKLYCMKNKKRPKELNQAAQNKLLQYPWLGNVRELKNIAERLAVLSKSNCVDLQEIEAVLPKRKETLKTTIRIGNNLDKECLNRVLEETDYHYGKAAAKLGISRTTLWKRMKQFDENKTT
jgi:propionate catabolism operon transcriptional regulator